MAEPTGIQTAHPVEHVHHEELGFWRTYVFSTDHKTIGKQFLFLGLFMMVIGGLLALMLRWQLAWPETAVPGFGWVPEPYMFEGIIPPETYNMLFTMHATIMIFFVIMPILVGCFGNFLIPDRVGVLAHVCLLHGPQNDREAVSLSGAIHDGHRRSAGAHVAVAAGLARDGGAGVWLGPGALHVRGDHSAGDL